MRRVLRIAAVVALALAAGWWLFLDTPSRGANRPGVLRFGFWGDYQEFEMWQRIVAAFEAEHPGVEVRMEFVPGGGYPRKLSAWIASGTTPDVMLLQDEPFPRYMRDSGAGTEHPVLVDLTDTISGERYGDGLAVGAGDYWATAWESFGRQEADGWHQYGLPVFGGNNLVFYNRECFRRAGVPLPEETGIDEDWTVDEFVDLARRLTIRRTVDGRERIVQWGFSRPDTWLYWLPFIYACDAEILNPGRTEFVFTGPEALVALELWGDLNKRHRVMPASGDLGPMNENVAFLTGRVAMFTNGPWAMPFLNEAGVDYGVMYPPVSPSGRRGTRVTWDCVAVSGRLRDDPQKRRLATELAHFIASPEAARIIADVQRSVPANRAGTEAFVEGSEPRRARRFVEGLEFARVQPITLRWDDMDWALRDGMGPLTRGAEGTDPRAALNRMAELMLQRGIFPVRLPDGTLLQPERRP